MHLCSLIIFFALLNLNYHGFGKNVIFALSSAHKICIQALSNISISFFSLTKILGQLLTDKRFSDRFQGRKVKKKMKKKPTKNNILRCPTVQRVKVIKLHTLCLL